MLKSHLMQVGQEVCVVGYAEMRLYLDDWLDLCGRAIEDTVYYSPDYALALLDTVDASSSVHFVCARSFGKLIGLLPIQLNTWPLSPLIPAGEAWTTKYTFSTIPLLDRSCAVEAAGLILEGLRDLRASEWRFPLLNLEGHCFEALKEALLVRGISWATAASFNRATLSGGMTFDEHLQKFVSPKRRRDFLRTRRRLEEHGTLEHVVLTDGLSLAAGVKAFLDLEKSGWKGRLGTALACEAQTTEFALRAFSGSLSHIRIDLLKLNGKPIAAGVTAFAGSTGFTVKGAYDESYAKYGVGLLLEIEVLKSFLSERWALRLDSATAGEHVIDSLWPERKTVGALLISFSGFASDRRVKLLIFSMSFQRRMKALLKRIIGSSLVWFRRRPS